MSHCYALYGLTVCLPFSCPFLPEAKHDGEPEVLLVHGEVPKALPDALVTHDTWETGVCWQAAPGRFLVKGGRKSGRFLVEDGCRITLQCNPEALDDLILFHLFHPVAAALFRQRGLLTLHASTVASDGEALVLCGESGAGKSTTLTAMLKKGCAMVSDDLTVVRPGGCCVEALTGPPRMHLCEDAAHRLGFAVEELDRHPARSSKRAVSAAGEARPVPLQRLCILEHASGSTLKISRPQGADKLHALMGCVYGPLFQEEHSGLFALFSAVAEQADIIRIQRPVGRWSVDEVIEAVRNG